MPHETAAPALGTLIRARMARARGAAVALAVAFLAFPTSLPNLSAGQASCGIDIGCWLAALLDAIGNEIIGGISSVIAAIFNDVLQAIELAYQVLIAGPASIVLAGYQGAAASIASLGLFGPIIALLLLVGVIFLLWQVDLPELIGGAKEDENDAVE